MREGGWLRRETLVGVLALCAGTVGLVPRDAGASPPVVTFTLPTANATGDGPQTAVAADLNGDAAVDLVVANSLADTVSVLLGVGGGTLAPRVDYAVGDDPVAIAVDDLDGDLVPDLVVANYLGYPSPLLVGSVSVLLGAGDGTFGAATDYTTGETPRSVAIGDLNGDTIPDLAVADANNGNAVSILLGNGDGTFAPRVDHPVTQPSALAMGDLNGDSILDLAVVSSNGFNRVSILLGVGDGTFLPGVEHEAGVALLRVVIGDLNGDAALDLVFGTGIDRVNVSLGAGDGTFTSAAFIDFPSFSDTTNVALGDLNGDGMLDLAVPSAQLDTVWALVGVGDGTFAPAQGFASGDDPVDLAIADLSGDGHADLAVANAQADTVSVLLNAGPQRPSEPTIGTATAGNEQATVSWTAPSSDGGSAITGYIVTPYVGYVSQGPRFFASTATAQTITGLTNGTTYRFRVRAWNAVGVSGFSTIGNPVTPSPVAPGAPTIGAAVAGDGSATVSWTAPVSDGGSPITGYVVTPYVGFVSQGPRYFVSTATTQTITGLTNGTTYRFKVRAWNAVGVSGFSGTSNPVTPTP